MGHGCHDCGVPNGCECPKPPESESSPPVFMPMKPQYQRAVVALDGPGPNYKADPPKPKRNPKIRLEANGYRVIAPNGREQKDRYGNVQFFANGGLVIEKLSKNALDEPVWERVFDVRSASGEMSVAWDSTPGAALAIFKLLVGDGAR